MSYFKHPTAVIDEPVSIGDNTKIWLFTHIAENARIGSDCIIGQNVYVGKGVLIGDRVKIQNNVSVYEGVVCEDEVFLGPSVVFTNISNPRSMISRKHLLIETIIRKGASIGANATIVCGNEVGSYALVGAGAVVTKPVPDFALVMGNPARQVGWVSEYGHRLNFNELNEAQCPESQQKYKMQLGKVIRIN